MEPIEKYRNLSGRSPLRGRERRPDVPMDEALKEARADLARIEAMTGRVAGAYEVNIAQLLETDPKHVSDTIDMARYADDNGRVNALCVLAEAFVTGRHDAALYLRILRVQGHDWFRLCALQGLLRRDPRRGIEEVRTWMKGEPPDAGLCRAVAGACDKPDTLVAVRHELPEVFIAAVPYLSFPYAPPGNASETAAHWQQIDTLRNQTSASSGVGMDMGYNRPGDSYQEILGALQYFRSHPDWLRFEDCVTITCYLLLHLSRFNPTSVPAEVRTFLRTALADPDVIAGLRGRFSGWTTHVQDDDGNPLPPDEIIRLHTTKDADRTLIAERIGVQQNGGRLPLEYDPQQFGLSAPYVGLVADWWRTTHRRGFFTPAEAMDSLYGYLREHASPRIWRIMELPDLYGKTEPIVSGATLPKQLRRVVTWMTHRDLPFEKAVEAVQEDVGWSYGGYNDTEHKAPNAAVAAHRPAAEQIWRLFETKTPEHWLTQMFGGHYGPQYTAYNVVIDDDPGRFVDWVERTFVQGTDHGRTWDAGKNDAIILSTLLNTLAEYDDALAHACFERWTALPWFRNVMAQDRDRREVHLPLVEFAYRNMRRRASSHPLLAGAIGDDAGADRIGRGLRQRAILFPGMNPPADAGLLRARTLAETIVERHLPEMPEHRTDARSADLSAFIPQLDTAISEAQTSAETGTQRDAVITACGVLRGWAAGEIGASGALSRLEKAGLLRTHTVLDPTSEGNKRLTHRMLSLAERFSVGSTGRSIVQRRAPYDPDTTGKHLADILIRHEHLIVEAAERERIARESSTVQQKLRAELEELLSKLEGAQKETGPMPDRGPQSPIESPPGEALLGTIEWVPTGHSQYLLDTYFDRFDDAACAHLPVQGADARAFFERLEQGRPATPMRPMRIQYLRVRNGSVIPLPHGAVIRPGSVRSNLPQPSLTKQDDGTYRLKAGFVSAHEKSGAMEVTADVPTADVEPGNATIAEVRAAADTLNGAPPARRRGLFSRVFGSREAPADTIVQRMCTPFSELKELPSDLRDTVRRAQRAPTQREAVAIIRTAMCTFTYDLSLMNDEAYKNTLRGMRDGTLNGNAYLKEIYRQRRGICGDLSTVMVDLLRHAGVPALAARGYAQDSTQIRDLNCHMWATVLQMTPDGRLFLAPEEATSGASLASVLERRRSVIEEKDSGHVLTFAEDETANEAVRDPEEAGTGKSGAAGDAEAEVEAENAPREIRDEWVRNHLETLRLTEIIEKPKEARALITLTRSLHQIAMETHGAPLEAEQLRERLQPMLSAPRGRYGVLALLDLPGYLVRPLARRYLALIIDDTTLVTPAQRRAFGPLIAEAEAVMARLNANAEDLQGPGFDN